MKISLESLLQRLVLKGSEAARSTSPDPGTSAPTSIRLKPATRHFLDCQSLALNTSVQSVISMILDGVAEMTVDNTSGALRTIRERFFYLFQSHELDLPGIVSVMKQQGFTLSTLDNPARILDLLDQKAIRHLAETFFVRPEWISGARNSVIELGVDVRWYKNVYAAAKKLLKYAELGYRPHVMFLRREYANFANARADNDSGKADPEPIGVAVRLYRSTDDGVSFTTYEVWSFERWNYWRCREQIKLLIAFCDQAHRLISYAGYELPNEDIEALQVCKAMPAVIMKKIHQVSWYPDDYACLRDKVTKETEDWPLIQKQYEDGKYDRMLNEALYGQPESPF
ncbi:hypothetical protein [Janthinobacterium sp. LB3P112]|uniref:hypothetical protein n=1 Tax=Janthinobacterium sp. LB3P112 TaxID=3424196 RepID=UPI003F254141